MNMRRTQDSTITSRQRYVILTCACVCLCACTEHVCLQWAGLGSASRRVIGSVVPLRPSQCLRVCGSVLVYIMCVCVCVYKRVSKRSRSVQSVSIWGELRWVCSLAGRPVAQRRLSCFPMSQPVRDGESGVPLQLGQDHQHLPAWVTSHKCVILTIRVCETQLQIKTIMSSLTRQHYETER